MNESIYTETNQLLTRVGSQLREPGQESSIGNGVTLPHYPIKDTALAACLATLGIPLREPAPFTDDVELDSGGNEVCRRTVWWLGDIQRDGGAKAHKTEELMGAWLKRELFEKEHPLHPLVYMRAVIDARAQWVRVITAWTRGAALLPTEVRSIPTFRTESIHEASILVACGFTPVAFNNRTFIMKPKGGVSGRQIIAEASLSEGAAPHQWMRKVLANFSEMLKAAKAQSIIILQRIDSQQAILLTADATKKTRDTFHRLIA